MSPNTVFEVRKGMIEIVFMYWHTSADPSYPKNKNNEIIRIHGKKEDRPPLYLHIRVRDLFKMDNGAPRVYRDAKIEIDFLSFPRYRIEDLFGKNDLDGLGEQVNYMTTITLNLNPNGASVKEGQNADVVTGLFDTPLPLTVTRIGERNSNAPSEAYHYDLCFEVKLSERLEKTFFNQTDIRSYVFAWAWVVHSSSKKEYEQGLNTDITDQEKRLKFLKNSEASILTNAARFYLDVLNWNHAYSRSDLYTGRFGDGFPYDEPSMNFIEMHQTLPFSSFLIGAQLGPVGICTIGNDYFDHHVKEHRMHRGMYIVNKIPSVHPKLDTDDNFRPDFVIGKGVVCHGLKSKLDEFHSRADHRFIFKQKSACHWINSLEKTFPGSSVENGFSPVLKKGSYPFQSGKVEIVAHDFVLDYSATFKALKTHYGSERFYEQKVLDLENCETIQIVPDGEIKRRDGSIYAKIGKGLPGGDRFLSTIHNKVYLHGDVSGSVWQTHSVCQRPLLLCFELARDLTEHELEILKNKPITLKFCSGDPQERYQIPFPLQIDYTKASKKGLHAVLLYIISNEARIEVFVDANGVVPARNWTLRDGTNDRQVDFFSSIPSKIDLYNPENSGLFQNNPIIIIDDYKEDDIRANKLRKLKRDYEKGIKKEAGKFLLGFIPKVGDIASSGWEMAVEWSDGDVPTEKKIDISFGAVKLFIEEVLQKKDPDGNWEVSKSHLGSGKKVLCFALKISELSKRYADGASLASSPFFNDHAFGEGSQSDSLYLLAADKMTYTFDRKNLSCSKTQVNGVTAFFMNREIVVQGKQPFNVQFGTTAGFLTRKEYNAFDSLSVYRSDYQTKLISFKELFRSNDTTSAVTYIRRLAASTPGKRIADILRTAAANKAMVQYTEANDIAGLFSRSLKNSSGLSDSDKMKLTAYLNLIMYIDAAFVYCPACGNIVSLSWGWCPYHATRDFFSKNGIIDSNGDGNLKKEFIQYILKNKDYRGKSISDLITSIPDQDRIFVHWTEFLIT